MNGTQKQDSLKEMLEILKGDYSYPVKIWLWGLCKALHNPHYAKKVIMRSSA